MSDASDPIAILQVSPARRLFGTAVQAVLGILLISLPFTLPEPTPAGSLILFAVGGFILWQAGTLYKSTDRDLVLTRAGLFESGGTVVATMDNIVSVDRGIFAVKPSNGFTIRLKEAQPRAWVPGLWWRFGTRVGVGGATSGKAARDMADVIAILLADPDAGRSRPGD